MKRIPSYHQKRTLWLLPTNGRPILSLFSGVLTLCLSQWVTLGLAQSSTGLGQVPSNTILDTGTTSGSPGTSTTVQAAEVASSTLSYSQTMPAFVDSTPLASHTSHHYSSPASIFYSSDSIFYSSATFSILPTARHSSIFIANSETIASLTTQNSILQSGTSTYLNSTLANSVFAGPSSSLLDQRHTLDSASLISTMIIPQSSGIDSKSSSTASPPQHITTVLPVSMSEVVSVMLSSASSTSRLGITSHGADPKTVNSNVHNIESSPTSTAILSVSSLPSVNTGSSQLLQPNASTPFFPSAITLSLLQPQSSSSNPSLPSAATVSSQTMQPSASNPFLPLVATVSSQTLQPSASNPSVPLVATVSSQAIQESASNPSLPLVATVSSQTLQPSALNPSLPSVVTVSSQILQPSPSNPSLPLVATISFQTLQPSASNPSLPLVATISSQAMQESASNPSLPLVATVSFQTLQPSASNPSLPLVATVSSQILQPSPSNPSLPLVATISFQTLQPSASNPSLPLVATISSQAMQESASNPSLPLVATVSFQTLQPSASNPSLPLVATVSSQILQPSPSNPSLPLVATVSSQTFQVPASNLSLPLVATVSSQTFQAPASNPSLPLVATVSSQSLQPSALNPSLPSAATVSSQTMQASASNPSLPSVATVLSQTFQAPASNPSLPLVATVSSQTMQASALNPSLPSAATVSSQTMQASASNPSLPLVATVSSQTFQAPASNPSLPLVATVSSQTFQAPASNPSLPLVATVSSQTFQAPASNPSLPLVATVSSQTFQAPASNPSLPLVATVSSQTLQPSASSLSVPSVVTVSSQTFQSSASIPSLSSVGTVSFQTLQPSASSHSLRLAVTVVSQTLQSPVSAATVSSQPLQSSASSPLLLLEATLSSQLLQPLQPSASSPSLPSAVTVASQSLLPSASNPSLPPSATTSYQTLQPSASILSIQSLATVSSQLLQPSASNPFFLSVTTVSFQPLQLSASVPSLPSLATVSSQPLQPSASNPFLASTVVVASQIFQPSASASTELSQPPQSSAWNPFLPSVTTVSFQLSRQSASNGPISSVATSQPLQQSISDLSMPLLVTVSQPLQQSASISFMPSIFSVSSQPLQSSMSYPYLSTVVTKSVQPLESSAAIPSSASLVTVSSEPLQLYTSITFRASVATISSQQVQSSALSPSIPSVVDAASSPFQQPLGDASMGSSVVSNFFRNTISTSGVAIQSDVSTPVLSSQQTLASQSMTTEFSSYMPISTSAFYASVNKHASYSQSTELSQQSEMSTALLITPSQSGDALSSTITINAGQDNTVYSSLYPCWISYFIEQTMDASAIYPNQSLFTTLSLEPSSSYAFSSDKLVNSDVLATTPVPSSKSLSVSPNILESSIYVSSIYETNVLAAIASYSTTSTDSPLSITKGVSEGLVGSSIHPTALFNTMQASSVSQSYPSYQDSSRIFLHTTGLLSPLLSSMQESFTTLKTSASSSESEAITFPTESITGLPSSVDVAFSSTMLNNVAKRRRRRDVVIASSGVTTTISLTASSISSIPYESIKANSISLLSSSVRPGITQLFGSSSNMWESALNSNSQPDVSFQSTTHSVNSETYLPVDPSSSSTASHAASSIPVLPSTETTAINSIASTFSQNMQGDTSLLTTLAELSSDTFMPSSQRQTLLTTDPIYVTVASSAASSITVLSHSVTSIINGSSTKLSTDMLIGTSNVPPQPTSTEIYRQTFVSSDPKFSSVMPNATAPVSVLLSSVISGPNQSSTTLSGSMRIETSNVSPQSTSTEIYRQTFVSSDAKFSSVIPNSAALVSVLPSSVIYGPNQSSTTIFRNMQIETSNVSPQPTSTEIYRQTFVSSDAKFSSVIPNSAAPVSVLPSSVISGPNQSSTTLSGSMRIETSNVSPQPTPTEIYRQTFVSSDPKFSSVMPNATAPVSVLLSSFMSVPNQSSTTLSGSMRIETSNVSPQPTPTEIYRQTFVSSDPKFSSVIPNSTTPVSVLLSSFILGANQSSSILSGSMQIETSNISPEPTSTEIYRQTFVSSDAKFSSDVPNLTAPVSVLPSSFMSVPNQSSTTLSGSVPIETSNAYPQPTTTGINMPVPVSSDAKFASIVSNTTVPVSVLPSSVNFALSKSSTTLSPTMSIEASSVSLQATSAGIYMQASLSSDIRFLTVIPSATAATSVLPSSVKSAHDQLSINLSLSMLLGTSIVSPQPTTTGINMQVSLSPDATLSSITSKATTPISVLSSSVISGPNQLSTTLYRGMPTETSNVSPQVASSFQATTRTVYFQTPVSAESVSTSALVGLSSPNITTGTTVFPLKPSVTMNNETAVGTVLPSQSLTSSLSSNQQSVMISSSSFSRSDRLPLSSASALTVGATSSSVSVVPSSPIISANIIVSSLQIVRFSTDSTGLLPRTQATFASMNPSISVSLGKESVLALSSVLGQSASMNSTTSILQSRDVPGVSSLSLSSINISSEVLSSLDLGTSIINSRIVPSVSSQRAMVSTSGSIFASTAPAGDMYESSKMFSDSTYITLVNSQSQVKTASLEPSLHISTTASSEPPRLTPTVSRSLASDIPAYQSSSYLTVPVNLVSSPPNSFNPSAGVLESSYIQETTRVTAKLSTVPTVLTSKDMSFGTIATFLSSTYTVKATPRVTTTIGSSADFSATLQPSPSTTTTGGVVRVLTSSLGQCIAYYTSKFEPKPSIAQTSNVLLSTLSVGHTSVISASQSTKISSGQLTASTTSSVDITSIVPPTLSSQNSTGVYLTEISSSFSSMSSSAGVRISTSIILPSSLVFLSESSVHYLVSAPLHNETVTALSTSNLPIVATSSFQSSEDATSVHVSAASGSSVLQTSITQSFFSTPKAVQSSSIDYESSLVSHVATVSSSLVSISSSIVLYDSPQPTLQTSEIPSSRLPLASSALYSSLSASSVLTEIGSISSPATSQIQPSSRLPMVTIGTSIYSVQQGSSSHLTVAPSLSSEAASSTNPTIVAASTNLISSSESLSIAPATLSSTTAILSSAIPTTQPPVTTQPISVGLCSLLLIVAQSVDVTTPAFKLDIETKLLRTYLALKVKRRKRAVTEGSTTLNVTSIARQGSTSNVETQFYVTESNVVVSAERTSSTFNQLTTTALSSRLNQTVGSTITAAGLTTQPTVITTINPPMEYQLLGMVLRDDASNNISTGNNRQSFETTMANYYKAGKNISGVVAFTAYYIKHEVKNIVYLEFFVTVDNIRQNSSTVASFYSLSNPPVSPATLSALLKMTVITVPYSISSITASDIYQVVMTIRPVNTYTNINSNAFKSDLALRISAAYREGKDTTTARRKRRALGSISTTILSVLSTTNNQASVKFFILDQGTVVNGAEGATILNRLGITRISSLLGVEVIVLPAAVSISPVPATSEPDLWIIGVVLGACVVMIIFFAIIYWRWQAGGPTRKLDLEKIQMVEKGETATKSYGGYRDIAKYTAEGRSEGAPGLKTTAFTQPADVDEKPDMSRSIRRKGAPNDAASRGISKGLVNGRKNASYEESEEEYEDDEEEDEDDEDEDDYESDIPAPRQPSRPVSVQRKVEVQPGPTRDSRKVAEKVQRRDAGTKKYVVDKEETETESEDEFQEKRELPAAAELPPLSKMKDVQEAPTYPPVRFRTNIEPESSRMEPLPPISKHASLTAKPLPSIDPELRQKTDLERSRNKQRQRLRASGKWNGTSTLEAAKSDRRAWRKAQSDIDALLDPFSASLKQSPRSTKRAKRRHRLRRSHKVDIAIDGVQKETDENKNVKLNNYMKLDSPSYSIDNEKSPDIATDDEKEKTIEDARERIHNLLDDAFSLLEPYQYARKLPREKVTEKMEVERVEAQQQQAPPEMENEQPRYPALPPPPHGRATTPLPGGRKRIVNYPFMRNQHDPLPSNEPPALAPVMTRDPMVVMDRGERNRYLSQQLGHPGYNRPYDSLSYPYSQTPSEQPVYITPVQQQPDNLAGVIWSPYTTEILRDDVNSTAAPLINTIGSPHRNQYSMKTAPNVSTTPKAFESMRPRHTSIDMSNPVYDSPLYASSPQPLIRAIKEELLRLSRNAPGKTKIEELKTSQDQGRPIT